MHHANQFNDGSLCYSTLYNEIISKMLKRQLHKHLHITQAMQRIPLVFSLSLFVKYKCVKSCTVDCKPILTVLHVVSILIVMKIK